MQGRSLAAGVSVVRRRRLRARRRDDHPRPAERAGIHRISGRRDAVRVPRLRSRNGRTLNSPLKFGLPRSSLFPRFSRRRPFIPSDRDGLFVPRAIEAVVRRGILHAPGGRGHCALAGSGELRSRRHLEPEPIDPRVALRPGIARYSTAGPADSSPADPRRDLPCSGPSCSQRRGLPQAPAPSSPVRSDPWCCTIVAPCWDGPDSPDELTDLSLSHPRHNTSPPDGPLAIPNRAHSPDRFAAADCECRSSRRCAHPHPPT